MYQIKRDTLQVTVPIGLAPKDRDSYIIEAVIRWQRNWWLAGRRLLSWKEGEAFPDPEVKQVRYAVKLTYTEDLAALDEAGEVPDDIWGTDKQLVNPNEFGVVVNAVKKSMRVDDPEQLTMEQVRDLGLVLLGRLGGKIRRNYISPQLLIILLSILGFATFLHLIPIIGQKLVEQDCREWQKYERTYPMFEASDADINRCANIGIHIEE